MFGLGAGELLVLLVVALLFLGPEKLPDAAKSISKGIRDFRKHTRELQDTLEEDTQIGDAYRDLKSALRGDELRTRRSPPAPRKALDGDEAPALTPGAAEAGVPTAGAGPTTTVAGEPAAAAPSPEPAAATVDADDELPRVRPASGAVARTSATAPTEPEPTAPQTDEDHKAHG
jgi:sec-independent protein translocase protein TatB